jgi:hypothetical protein
MDCPWPHYYIYNIYIYCRKHFIFNKMIRMYEGYWKLLYSSVPMDRKFDLAYSSNYGKPLNSNSVVWMTTLSCFYRMHCWTCMNDDVELLLSYALLNLHEWRRWAASIICTVELAWMTTLSCFYRMHCWTCMNDDVELLLLYALLNLHEWRRWAGSNNLQICFQI